MHEVREDMPPHGRVVIQEPAGGWSRRYFDREIAQYVADRGMPPRTVTLHPETMAALGYSMTWVNASKTELPPVQTTLVPSPDYDRGSITLYE